MSDPTRPEPTTDLTGLDGDTNAPLREDVRRLGSSLGQWIRTRSGEPLYATVERARALSKAARGGDQAAATQLGELLSALPSEEARVVARAFATFLTLANIAEQHHRTRRRRERARLSSGAAQRGSLRETWARLSEAGIAPDALRDAALEVDVELVLTAHPTELNRRTLLQRHADIARWLAHLDRPDLAPFERERAQDELHRLVGLVWESDEVLRRRPTPLEEARSGLLVFEQSLWEAVPRLLRQLDTLLLESTGQGLPINSSPIRFGSWIGGDRDGNPNVTHEVTAKALATARWMAADLLWREVDALRGELSIEAAPSGFRSAAGSPTEPYRAWLGQVRARLSENRREAAEALEGRTTRPGARRSQAAIPDAAASTPASDAPTLTASPTAYESTEELAEDLRAVREALLEVGLGEIAAGRLLDLERRVTAFGLTLVSLDIRQEADRHRAVWDALCSALGRGTFSSWEPSARREFLAQALDDPRPLLPRGFRANAEVNEVLDTLFTLARSPSEGLGAYVVSMAASAEDVLAVEVLQRECGVARPLRVVPLFETLADLDRSPAVLDELLSVPSYRRLIAERGERLEVMVGYSDSAKDAGLVAASWALWRAQEALLAVAERHGVRLVVFHGRGGSVGRGGASAHQAVLGLPRGSVHGAMRVTEQGEMIQAKFGLADLAVRNLELTVSAMLEGNLLPVPDPSPTWRATMDIMAEHGTQAYRSVVRAEAGFVPWFRRVTPEPELGSLNVGSRPARRRSDGGVESLRAIPWQFAWTQTRLLLPSWLGLGEALEAALTAHGPDGPHTLGDMEREWPFFGALLDLCEMVLAKAEPRIHAVYEERLGDLESSALGHRLLKSIRETKSQLLRVRERSELLRDRPVLARSIAVRNPYVDPINILQAELLHRLRSTPEAAEDPVLQDALRITINGIAAGMRNTG